MLLFRPAASPLGSRFVLKGATQFTIRTGQPHRADGGLFCLDGSTMVLLHGFQKKSQKTPKADLELARRRMRDEEEKA
jgi:phage-related protein